MRMRTPRAHARRLRLMAPGLIGSEVLPLHRQMDQLLAGHNDAKAALDIAAYDLRGKHLKSAFPVFSAAL